MRHGPVGHLAYPLEPGSHAIRGGLANPSAICETRARTLAAMARIKAYIAGWTESRPPAEIVVLVAGAIVIAVVPGALMVWLAWRGLRARG